MKNQLLNGEANHFKAKNTPYFKMRRTVTVKLPPSKGQEEILKELTTISSKVWNKVNYLRRQEHFKGKPIDFQIYSSQRVIQ